jgi:hypothetical protein
MKNIFRKILTLMKGSVMTRGGKESSTRIMSYVISAIIVIFCFVFIGSSLVGSVIETALLLGLGRYALGNRVFVFYLEPQAIGGCCCKKRNC